MKKKLTEKRPSYLKYCLNIGTILDEKYTTKVINMGNSYEFQKEKNIKYEKIPQVIKKENIPELIIKIYV